MLGFDEDLKFHPMFEVVCESLSGLDPIVHSLMLIGAILNFFYLHTCNKSDR